MGIFSKALSEGQLEQRISELKENEKALRKEKKQVQKLHSEALALGGDTAKTKKRLAEINADLESLPSSILLVQEELRQRRIENETDVLLKYQEKTLPAKLKNVETLSEKFISTIRKMGELNSEIKAAVDDLITEAHGLEIINLISYPTGYSPLYVAASKMRNSGNYGSVSAAVDSAAAEIAEHIEGYSRNLTRDTELKISGLGSEIKTGSLLPSEDESED